MQMPKIFLQHTYVDHTIYFIFCMKPEKDILLYITEIYNTEKKPN
jgi:hypothetical protein